MEREEATVFFESTHRLIKALESMRDTLQPDRMVCVCREMTKMHETITNAVILGRS